MLIVHIAIPPAHSDLVAHYEFEGNFLDSSAYANHGTGISGVNFVDGRDGQAASFDGNNSRVQVPHSASLNLNSGMTLAAWINPLSVPRAGNSGIIFKGELNNSQGPYELFITDATSNSQAGTAINDIDASTRQEDGYEFGRWLHMAATYDGSDLKLYLDGTLVSSTPYVGSINQEDSPLNIGQRFLLNHNPFDGLIDDVRVYDHALSANEVRGLVVPEPLTPLFVPAILAMFVLRHRKEGRSAF